MSAARSIHCRSWRMLPGHGWRRSQPVADGPSATLRFRCLQNANLHFAYLDAVGLEAVVATDQSSFGTVKALFR